LSESARQNVWARNWGRAALWLLALITLAGLLLASANLRDLLLEAARLVTPLSVLATLPGQAAAALLCAGALWALKPGVGFGSCLVSRLLRDASGNLPVSLPGSSTVIGARALVLAGGETRAAISASALDKIAETVAQFPFIILAVFVLWRELRGMIALPEWTVLAVIGGLVVAVIAAAALWRRFGAGSRFAARISDEWRKLLGEAKRQRAGFPLCMLLHFIAWLAGGLQIWMAALALGFDLTLYEAIAIESAAYAGRALFFFIPAGLVSQEAGLVAAGLLFGLAPAEALALGFVLRLRDLLMASGLLLWPWLEWRKRRA
jgi:hypothetical protein